MKLRLSSFLIAFGIFLPLATACTASATDDGANDDDSVSPEVKSGKKKKVSCASVFGQCVGLSPSSCKQGVWANANDVTCGGGLGVGCCIEPTFPPPPPPPPPLPPPSACAAKGGQCHGLSPSNCTDGTWMPVSTHSCGGGLGVGCCVSCPMLSPPAPSFCPGATITPKKDATTGCTIGYECAPPAANTCEAKGGSCVGLSPASCPSGNWGLATTHSCGPAIGVGCCLD